MKGKTGDEGGETTVRVSAGAASLEGNLTAPGSARGIVLFARGSGSSRHSPRNRSFGAASDGSGSLVKCFTVRMIRGGKVFAAKGRIVVAFW